jgi:hypothetical protein
MPTAAELAPLASFDCDLAAVSSMAGALGLHSFETSRCPLHENCEAFLALAKSGHWLYHCQRHPKGITLAGARAYMAGRSGKLGSVERATWKLRLLHESGLATPADVAIEPLSVGSQGPIGRSAETVQKTYDGFALLIRLRWIARPGEPVTFCREFACAWCGLRSPDQARTAIDVLHGLGYLVPAGFVRTGRYEARLWLPKLIRSSEPMRPSSQRTCPV